MVPHPTAPRTSQEKPQRSCRNITAELCWVLRGLALAAATVLLMPWTFPLAWKPWPSLAIMRPSYIRQSWNFYCCKEVHQQPPFPSRQFLKERCKCLFIFQTSDHLFQGLAEKQEEWKCLSSCNVAGTLLPTRVPKCFYKWTSSSSFKQPLPLHRVSSSTCKAESGSVR